MYTNNEFMKQPQGDELSRMVATALGYHVYSLNNNPWGHIIKQPNVWFLWLHELTTEDQWHDIMRMAGNIRAYITEEEAWLDTRYADDTDEALALPLPEGHWFEVKGGGETRTWWAKIVSFKASYEGGPNESLATSACRAWLTLRITVGASKAA